MLGSCRRLVLWAAGLHQPDNEGFLFATHLYLSPRLLQTIVFVEVFRKRDVLWHQIYFAICFSPIVDNSFHPSAFLHWPGALDAMDFLR